MNQIATNHRSCTIPPTKEGGIANTTSRTCRMVHHCRFIYVIVSLVMVASRLQGAEIWVDAVNGSNPTGDGSQANPYQTIQEGLNHIWEHDSTLHIAAGTYMEALVLQNLQDGLIMLGAGADVVTINASGVPNNGGAIKLQAGMNCTFRGLTVTGGTYEGLGSPGGAVRCIHNTGSTQPTASATIENCILINNRSWGYKYTGGAITLGSGSIIRNNVIMNNGTVYGAGAIYVGANSVVEDNLIAGNSAGDNSNDGSGAMEALYDTIIVRRNTFLQNLSGWNFKGRGGAFSGRATVYNNLFIKNSVNSFNSGHGGAAYLTGGVFVNNTLVGNIGDLQGFASGIYCAGAAQVRNNIICCGEDGVGLYGGGGEPDYNAYYDNELGPYGGTAIPGAHDLHSNPSLSSEYRLTAASPCIDAGTPSPTVLNSTDIDMQPRIFNGLIDIGADEAVIASSSILYTDGNVTTIWHTVEGALCQLQASSNLRDWADLGGAFACESNETAIPDPGTLPPRRFYRLSWQWK